MLASDANFMSFSISATWIQATGCMVHPQKTAFFFDGYLLNHAYHNSAYLNADRLTIKPFEFHSPVHTIKGNPSSIRVNAWTDNIF